MGQFTAYLLKCNSTLNPTCVSDSLLNTSNSYTVAFPTLNTAVNPENQNYKTIYMEDYNYFTFSAGLAVDSLIPVQ